MAGRISSKHHPETGAKEPVYNIRVSLPITDGSSKEIRDNILVDLFGYSEGDIKSFNERQNNCYFIIGDPNNPEKWATASQVNSWTLNADRTIQIIIPQKLTDDLDSFRRQRASFETFKVGMFITDSQTRKIFTDDLDYLFSATGNRRMTALNDLMVTISGSQTSRGEIYQALRFLIDQSGYKGNPFLLLAIAATTAYKTETPAFSSVEVSQAMIAAAVQAANNSLYNTNSSASSISRIEAARINYWASTLYDNINANGEASNRRWIQRFLDMSDDERRLYKVGDFVPITNYNQDSMRAPYKSEDNLKDATRKFIEQRQKWTDNDQIGQD